MISPDMIDTLGRYVGQKYKPGGFTYAVLAGDLYQAVRRADLQNRQVIPEIVEFIANTLPPESYGSYEKVKAWLGPNNI